VSIILDFFEHSVSEIGSRLVIKHLLKFVQVGIQLNVQKQQWLLLLLLLLLLYL